MKCAYKLLLPIFANNPTKTTCTRQINTNTNTNLPPVCHIFGMDSYVSFSLGSLPTVGHSYTSLIHYTFDTIKSSSESHSRQPDAIPIAEQQQRLCTLHISWFSQSSRNDKSFAFGPFWLMFILKSKAKSVADLFAWTRVNPSYVYVCAKSIRLVLADQHSLSCSHTSILITVWL